MVLPEPAVLEATALRRGIRICELHPGRRQRFSALGFLEPSPSQLSDPRRSAAVGLLRRSAVVLQGTEKIK